MLLPRYLRRCLGRKRCVLPCAIVLLIGYGLHERLFPDAVMQEADLAEVGAWPAASPSPQTSLYVQAIHDAAAADNATGGARILGHVYCRYFADLFGGQALAGPYRYALGLAPTSPRHYDFGAFGAARRESIAAIYAGLNEAGDALADDEAREAVVGEARTAFAHNVHVYREEGRLLADGALGIANMAAGFARARMAAA